MAIRDTLTGIGKRTAQGILGSNLRRVAGGFASLIGGPNRTASGDFEGINRKKTAISIGIPSATLLARQNMPSGLVTEGWQSL